MFLSFENISHSYAGLPSVNDVSFTLAEGEVVSLLGPSGCGKSTLLRLAAGLEVPQAGQIIQNDVVISAPGFAVEPDKRGIGLVFQNYALFPHLTVLENVCYGLQGSKKDQGQIAHDVMEDFDISHLSDQYPHELSGGQQQRVALARAICPSPSLVLLDEPFSGLDTRLRERVRDRLLHVLREKGIAAIMVTHDAEEAMFMSHKIVVLEQGKVAQIGRPLDVYSRPKTSFVATFFGEANEFKAIVKNSLVQTVFGEISTQNVTEGAKVEVVVRNDSLRVHNLPVANETAPVFSVLETHLLGSSTLVHLSDGTHHFHAKIPGLNYFESGAEVYLTVAKDDVLIFPEA